MLHLAALMRRRHGRRWWLRGMAPTLGRAFVINSVNFLVFERVVEHVERLASESAEEEESL